MSVISHIEIKSRQLHKFGGSSLADVNSYLCVAGIMKEYSHPDDIMVVSAAGNTTNQLINWLQSSRINHLSAYFLKKKLQQYHIKLITGLLPLKIAKDLINLFNDDLERLAILLDNDITDIIYAEVVGHGEIWSARLMAAVLEQQGLGAIWLDAREFLRAERSVQPQINERLSYPLLHKLLNQHKGKRIVITGFISRSITGETVLLGRNGSDYSATQIGALAGVSHIIIWSDVAGIYSADPRKVKDACLLPLVCLEEANELARLASPLLHARTLQPIAGSGIELQLRCSSMPKQESTRIEHVLKSDTGARIVTSREDICLIEFQVPADQDFKRIYKNINIILKHIQGQPLAVGIHYNRNLIQLCYIKEKANNVLQALRKASLSGELRLRHGLALVALVGVGVTNNPIHCHCFWQHLQDQSVEFTCKSEDGISLVAVLSNGPTENIIQSLHTSIFHNEKPIGLMLFSKDRTDYTLYRFCI